jgi:LacI family transcriptional regulator
MPRRPTIAMLAAEAGVSVATVDRVLNGRLPVRAMTAERVVRAADAIGYHAAASIRQRLLAEPPRRRLGFLLQKRHDTFYQILGRDVQAATLGCGDIRGTAAVSYMDDLSPALIAERLLDLGRRVDAIAVVSVDHPYVSEAIAALARKNVPVFAMLTDLTAPASAGYVGRDNRKEGRTAAWMIARTAHRPGRIGIIMGSHRYLCQETAETSFRSFLREHAPDFRPLDPLVNLEDAAMSRAATVDMISHVDDLAGVYICGGGVDGVIDGARDMLSRRRVVVICNELTPKTRAGLLDGVVTAVISTRTLEMAEATVQAMARRLAQPEEQRPVHVAIPFDLYVPENV